MVSTVVFFLSELTYYASNHKLLLVMPVFSQNWLHQVAGFPHNSELKGQYRHDQQGTESEC